MGNDQRPIGPGFYRFAHAVLRAFCVIVYPSAIRNAERLERDAPYLLTSNHQSMMDPILIAVRVKRHQIRFLGKDTLRRVPLVRWLVDHLHMISVVRNGTDMAAMRACLNALNEGHVVGIFPEGTRKEASMMESMGSGIGLIALRSGVPIVPVCFADKPRPFRKTRILVGETIDYEDLKRIGTNKQTCEELTERIRRATFALKRSAENK